MTRMKIALATAMMMVAGAIGAYSQGPGSGNCTGQGNCQGQGQGQQKGKKQGKKMGPQDGTGPHHPGGMGGNGGGGRGRGRR